MDNNPDPADFYSWPIGEWYYSSYYEDWNYRIQAEDFVSVFDKRGFWEMEYDYGGKSRHYVRIPETVTTLEEAQTYALTVARMGAA